MRFVSDNVFHIEKSPQYAAVGDSVKTVEFVRAIGEKLLFVEAKSSFSNPNSLASNRGMGNKTVKEIFQKEIAGICDKFTHSLNLYSSVSVTKEGFPPGYVPAARLTLTFMLVTKGFEESWCDEIERALNRRIRESVCMSKMWKPEVVVINDATAAKRKIAVSYEIVTE
ncbi:MAG: hypothetical protein LBP22_01250 [Deltaproteobacteria bacterium]|jgi:hypothetical protein|nr:hypothetical protein [Deltaproteobacteria bacterium]